MLHSCYWDHVSFFPIQCKCPGPSTFQTSDYFFFYFKKSYDFQSNENYQINFIPENQSMMKADNEMSDGNYVSYTTHSDALKILPN